MLTADRPARTSKTTSATAHRGKILPAMRVLHIVGPATGPSGKLPSTTAAPVAPIPVDQEAPPAPEAAIPNPTPTRIRTVAGARIRGRHHTIAPRVPARPDTAEVRIRARLLRIRARLRRDSRRPRDIRLRRIDSVVAPTGRMRKRSYVFEKNTPSASSSFATLIRLVGATPAHNNLSVQRSLIQRAPPSTRRRAPL